MAGATSTAARTAPAKSGAGNSNSFGRGCGCVECIYELKTRAILTMTKKSPRVDPRGAMTNQIPTVLLLRQFRRHIVEVLDHDLQVVEQLLALFAGLVFERQRAAETLGLEGGELILHGF